MQNKQHITSGAPWEKKVGYSRAIRIGNCIEVSGTTSTKNGEVSGVGDMYLQAITYLQIIQRAIEEAGGKISDVVRTRIYVTNIGKWEEAGKAHGEFFSEIRPATTLVEVSNLIHPDMLIEIEATAIIT